MAEKQVCEDRQEWGGNAAWGTASSPARVHLDHVGVSLWRLGEQSGGRSVRHFPGLARLPMSAHSVWGVTALGEGPGCSALELGTELPSRPSDDCL